MDPSEVIVVDDSPPPSPVPEHDDTMNYLDLSTNKREFCSPNEAMAWSQFTTKFISSTMNSVISSAGTCQANQNAAHNTPITKDIAHIQLARNQLYRQYHSPFACYTPSRPYGYFTNRSPQQHYMRDLGLLDEYYTAYDDGMAYPVPRTAVPDENYCFYNGHLQAPLRVAQTATADVRHTDAKTMPPTEHGDVNTLLADDRAAVSPAANVLLNPNNAKTKRQPTLPAGVRDNRKTVYAGATLVTQDTAMHMSDEAMEEEASVALDLSKHQDATDDSDDSDVVFMGMYRDEKKVPEAADRGNKTVRLGIRVASGNPDGCVPEERDTAEKQAVPGPRRNPRRQVQFAKRLKAANEVTFPPKTKAKGLRKSKRKNAPAGKTLRRSLRQLSNCGAVYCPPSPITSKHFRDWPVEGMHERPEYNPVTKKVEPFDQHIRNISTKNTTSPVTVKSTAKSDGCSQQEQEEDALAALCHEMLHHVLAYVATVQAVNDQQRDMDKLKETDNSTKTTFMTNLALNKHNSFNERVCDVFRDTVKGVRSNGPAFGSEMAALRDLIENSILLYCFTNNVTESKVAKYIASIKPDDIIRFSNEKFALPENVPN